MSTASGRCWEFALLPSWSNSGKESFSQTNGAGTLEITATTEMPVRVDMSTLAELLKNSLPAQVLSEDGEPIPGMTIESATLGEFHGFGTSYDANETHWRRWFVGQGTVFLLISYFCPIADKGQEDSQVDQMLCSLKERNNAL